VAYRSSTLGQERNVHQKLSFFTFSVYSFVEMLNVSQQGQDRAEEKAFVPSPVKRAPRALLLQLT
jgi:hypothetical protein